MSVDRPEYLISDEQSINEDIILFFVIQIRIRKMMFLSSPYYLAGGLAIDTGQVGPYDLCILQGAMVDAAVIAIRRYFPMTCKFPVKRQLTEVYMPIHRL